MKIHTTYTKFLNEANNLPDGIADYDGAWKEYEPDLIINVLYKLPGGDNKSWKKWVKNFEIIEVDGNGQPKWEIKLKNGDVMTAQRYSRFGQYKVELNGEQYNTAVIDNLGYDLMKLMLKPIEQYESQIQATDWYSHMADDHRSWKSGNQHKDTIRTIYTELKGGEKRKAWKLHSKYAPKDMQYSDFEKFDAAGGR
jgi:hypothetical protein